MDWTSFLTDSRSINALYSRPPSLHKIRVPEVRLHQDGPTVSIQFDVEEMPEIIPKKWLAAKANRVQITLLLIDIVELTISDWRRDNLGAIVVTGDEGSVNVRFVQIDGIATMAFSVKHLSIQSISAYCSEA